MTSSTRRRPSVERPWRLFWAVPLPDELRSRLTDAVAALRSDASADEAWYWSDPAGWHVTLAFIGGVSADAVPRLVSAVSSAVAGVEPFTAVTGGLGGFPSRDRARVVWYGVADPERRLRQLARRVRDASGLEEPSAFRAHVTLARSRERFGVEVPAGWSAAPMPEGIVEVRGVTLFRSHRGRGPARYESLEEVQLGVPAALETPA